MKIILSPAKQMVRQEHSIAPISTPSLIHQTKDILNYLLSLTYDQLKALWNCNDKLAQQNYNRLHEMNLNQGQTPAILSYDGIAFKYLAPQVLTFDELEYIQNHLYILSAFYGALRPLDGISPYRLEMQAKATVNGHKNLYDFWEKSIYAEVTGKTSGEGTGEATRKAAGKTAGEESTPLLKTIPNPNLYAIPESSSNTTQQSLCPSFSNPTSTPVSKPTSERRLNPNQDHLIINLASKEYSRCIEHYLQPEDTFITCIFGEEVVDIKDFDETESSKKEDANPTKTSILETSAAIAHGSNTSIPNTSTLNTTKQPTIASSTRKTTSRNTSSNKAIAHSKATTKIVQKGVYAKMARGDMVRFMAEHQIENPEEMKNYNRLGFSFCPERSTDSEFVFLRNAAHLE